MKVKLLHPNAELPTRSHVEQVLELDDTARGTGGLGSTDK